jgi:hypothetical protein
MTNVQQKLEDYERERIFKRNGGVWDANVERQLRRQLGRLRKPRVRRAVKQQMREERRRLKGVSG